MKYKVGDVVKVKSLKWYEENMDLNGYILVNCPLAIGHVVAFTKKMAQKYCGQQFKVKRIEEEWYFLDDSSIKFIDEFIEESIPKEVVEEAKLVYKTASSEFKVFLEDTFGKEFFVEDIRERVKNIGDARALFHEKHGRKKADMLNLPDSIVMQVSAYACALTVADALNEGWKPNWSDSSEDKFIVYNNMEEYGVTSINSDRYLDICFKSEELAEYFISQFPEICETLYKR